MQTNLAGVEGAAETNVNVVFEKLWIIFDRLRHCYRGRIRHAAVEQVVEVNIVHALQSQTFAVSI